MVRHCCDELWMNQFEVKEGYFDQLPYSVK